MTLRRGFKSEANWFAKSLRIELGLRPHEALSPWRLAEHLAIPVMPLSGLRQFAPQAVAFLMTGGRDKFSAVTVFLGQHRSARLICHNDANAPTRQASDISHELSHAILGHPPRRMLDDDPVAEEEARWMGPVLLVPDDAAHRIAARGQSVQDAASAYGVSSALMNMRLNVSGAMLRVKRSKATRSA